MKRSYVQAGIGFIPILMGFCSRLLFLLPIPLVLTNLLFFGLWIWLCFRFSDPERSLLPQFLRLSFPGAIVVVLALIQELIPGNNIPGIILSASQFYYLSGLALAGRILSPFLNVISASPYILTDYLLLIIISLLCMVLKKKVT